MSTSQETKLIITDGDGDTLTVTRKEVGEVVTFQFEVSQGHQVVDVSPADANVLFNFLAEG